MRGRRTRAGALALLLALAALPLLAGCGGSDFSDFTGDLKFGDEQVADTQVTDVMQVPNGGLGKLIGDAQIEWVRCGQGRGCSGTKDTSRELMKRQPSYQCMALSNTSQAESPTQGTWNWDGGRHACVKTRKLSWLERTLWGMYRKQSQGTIEWPTTSRNTLKADSQGVATLRANASPNYSSWDTNVNRYLKVAQGILVVAAAISLMVVGARLVWSIGGGASGGDGQLLGKIGWIFLGVFLGSSCASIALTFFAQASNSDTGRTPGMQSWSPGSGTGFFLSDWVRLQVDPFLLIAAVAGVLAAGFRLVTMQEGRGLVPLGKAFVTAMLTSVCLAGAVDLFQGTVDEWTAGVLRDASSMMNDAWQHNMLAASQFFALDGPLALLLTIVVWVCSMVSKIFCYLRAGMLPILVGVAPVWAAMSWTESGRQAFSRIMGWLVAFLLYKPVAALVMATGCAIMSTAGASDDSEAITLMLTISTIVLLPAMVKLVAPAVASSVAGGGQGLMGGVLGGIAGASVTLAGKAMMGGGKAAAGSLRSAFRSGGTPQGAKPAAATTGATAAAVCPGPVAEKMSRPRLVVSGRGLRWNPSHRKVHPAPLPLPAALRHHRHISLNRLHRQPHHRYRRCLKVPRPPHPQHRLCHRLPHHGMQRRIRPCHPAPAPRACRVQVPSRRARGTAKPSRSTVRSSDGIEYHIWRLDAADPRRYPQHQQAVDDDRVRRAGRHAHAVHGECRGGARVRCRGSGYRHGVGGP